MAISVKHSFTSGKADGTDSTLIQPSNWNAEHTITLAAGKVLGRDSSSAGAMQELPLSFDTSGNMAMSATGSFTPAVGTTAQRPGTPVQGMMRFNTTSAKVELYNGTIWGSVGGGATISDTAPSSPSVGDLWWKSDEGQMYVYYTDANSSQWVVANAFAGGAAYLPLAGGTLNGTLNGTSGTFSGTLSAATLSGSLNGSNLVNTSVAVGKINATGTPSASNFLRGDGSWNTAGAQGTSVVRLYTAGATWTKPAGLVQLKIEAWGAGGSGGVATNSGSSGASGGGGCAYAVRLVAAASLGATETVTIGAGGAGVTRSTAGATSGNAGGTTSFGTWLSITGGAGGSGVTTGTAAAAATGVATGADYLFAGTASAAQAANGCGGASSGGSAGGYVMKNGTTTYGSGGTNGVASPGGGVVTSLTASSGLIIVTEYY